MRNSRTRLQAARGLKFRPIVQPLEERCVLSAGLSASLVADIVPGTGSSNPTLLTVAGGAIYFEAADAAGDVGLWKSDGTAAGTVELKSGVASGSYIGDVPFTFAALGGAEYFTAPSGFVNGLWKTDGTPAGATLIKTYPNTAWGLTALNGKLFYSADDGVNGRELWVSDGTTVGTTLIDVYPGTYTYTYRDKDTKTKVTETIPNSAGVDGVTVLNNSVVFVARNSSGYGLWKSDGTPAGTVLIKTLSNNKSGLDAPPVVVGQEMYFGAAGYLWKSDGTAAGTVAIKNVQVSDLTNIGTTLYFRSGTYFSQLWTSNGTSTGTVLIKDFNYTSNEQSNIFDLTPSNGILYFSAPQSSSNLVNQLWRSNGTAAGTYIVKPIDPGTSGLPGGPAALADVNGLLYFGIDDGVHGNELWQSDGTAAGTVMVQDIYPGVDAYGNPNGSDPSWLVAFNGKLYFAATDPTHGTELWDPPTVPASATTTHQAHGPAQSAHPIRAARHPLGPAHHGPVSAFRPSSRRGHHGLSS
jgi:ELWxxDGT repeat protein